MPAPSIECLIEVTTRATTYVPAVGEFRAVTQCMRDFGCTVDGVSRFGRTIAVTFTYEGVQAKLVDSDQGLYVTNGEHASPADNGTQAAIQLALVLGLQMPPRGAGS